MRRSLTDRYVSVRQDVGGVSFMHAMVSSVDAVVIDQVLTAVAALAEPGDSRNLQQRRADGLLAESGGFGRVPAWGSGCRPARVVTFRSPVLGGLVECRKPWICSRRLWGWASRGG